MDEGGALKLMSGHFTIKGGYIVAEVELQPASVYGTGRAELPILVVPLQFTFRTHGELKCGLDFRELRCRISPFNHAYVAHSLPAHLHTRLKPGQQVTNQFVQLEVPIDRTRLALINRLRNGGDVQMRLDFELFVDELAEVIPEQGVFPSVWGLVERHQTQSNLQVNISRSEWLERVLPGTEFAKVHMIELPAIPIESCAGMKAAFEALQQAQKLEGQGFYDEAVSKCRIALEPFFEVVEMPAAQGGTKRIPQLKASWQTRLGQRTYDWLNSAIGAVKGATNQTHHLSSTSYDQLEAQMLLTVTTALIAYAVRTQPDR